MTNYDKLITLPVDRFNTAIINVVGDFGGNPDLILRYLKSTYFGGLDTIRDILHENYSGSVVTFKYNGAVYSCISEEDFLKKYGTISKHILSESVKGIRTGRNGNKTVVL